MKVLESAFSNAKPNKLFSVATFDTVQPVTLTKAIAAAEAGSVPAFFTVKPEKLTSFATIETTGPLPLPSITASVPCRVNGLKIVIFSV